MAEESRERLAGDWRAVLAEVTRVYAAYAPGDNRPLREVIVLLCETLEDIASAGDWRLLDEVISEPNLPFDIRLSLAVTTYRYSSRLRHRRALLQQLFSELPPLTDENRNLWRTVNGLVLSPGLRRGRECFCKGRTMSITLDDQPCPQCQKINWVNLGDLSDITAPDVEAIRCWSCGHEWFTVEDPELMYGPEATPADVMIENGKPTADEARRI